MLLEQNAIRTNAIRSNVIRTNAIRTNVTRTNAIRANVIRTDAIRSNVIRTNVIRTNVAAPGHRRQRSNNDGRKLVKLHPVFESNKKRKKAPRHST